MKYLDQYSIPLKGMNLGMHEYFFDIEGEFFQHIENSLISEGNFVAKVNCDKKENMFVLHFEITGTFSAPCDRCLVQIDVPAKIEYDVFLKTGISGTEAMSDDLEDDVIFVDEKESRFNIAGLLYQLIVLSMPLSNRYDCENDPDKKCDLALLAKLENEQTTDNEKDENDNPLWDSLKDIFKI
ncbi:MAG: YceD family protein [Deltaproteobacteria bacterium]